MNFSIADNRLWIRNYQARSFSLHAKTLLSALQHSSTNASLTSGDEASTSSTLMFWFLRLVGQSEIQSRRQSYRGHMRSPDLALLRHSPHTLIPGREVGA